LSLAELKVDGFSIMRPAINILISLSGIELLQNEKAYLRETQIGS
jgi:hypothetical protein